MKTVECYRADNGELEKNLDRAKAHDLHWALPKRDSQVSSEKVLDWFQCLRIMENADLVMAHLKEFIELRDAESKR